MGKEQVDEELSTKGLNQMDKTLCVRGTRISYSMWEVKGINIHFYFISFYLYKTKKMVSRKYQIRYKTMIT